MSLHSYSRCWLHLIWGTLNREKMLAKEAAARVSCYLTEYAQGKSIHMKINYVNADHVHALIDLPTGLPIEELMQLLKGSSSHWITSRARRNITVCVNTLTSSRTSFTDMGCPGTTTKAVETA